MGFADVALVVGLAYGKTKEIFRMPQGKRVGGAFQIGNEALERTPGIDAITSRATS